MVDTFQNLNEWKLDVELEILMDYIGCKNLGFTLQGIYLSEVALAVYLSWESSIPETETVKQCLGRLLRFLSARAEELGFVIPVMCLINIPKEANAEIKDKLNQLAADQDWHRGDFSIIVLTEKGEKNKDVEGVVQKMLGAASTAWPQIELKPRDIKAIINSFQSEKRSMQTSEEHTSLLDAIAQVLDKGDKEPVQNWLEERIEDTHRLMAGGENGEQ
ncbi:MAG: hypothetical protein PWP66_576 [Thermosediminibacterales bacterium]|jgi:hypothetical protein|nr:hypothetical protein [Thermosediminibacterales bacterium]MDK2901929.1 hypothetical protein [Thermosediminibacterales bacterium]